MSRWKGHGIGKLYGAPLHQRPPTRPAPASATPQYVPVPAPALPPAPTGLTAADLAHCAALGMDPSAYLAARTGAALADAADACTQLGIEPRDFEVQRLRERVNSLERAAKTASVVVALASDIHVALSAADLDACRALDITPEAYAAERMKELAR